LTDAAAVLAPEGELGPAHDAPDVVLLDGTGVRAGKRKNGRGANLAIGLTGRSGRPDGARSHLLGLTVDEDWSMMGAQLAGVAAPVLVVVDGETAITVLAGRLWPDVAIQSCWWHLPHGLRKAFYADDAANRHVNPRWATDRSRELGELLREQIRHERSTTEALTAWTPSPPASRGHADQCARLPPRRPAAHLHLPGPGPAPAAGAPGRPRVRHVLKRLMREMNARTDIGSSRWSTAGLRDLLTVQTARLLGHPARHDLKRTSHPSSTIPFRLQKFNEA
jgi:hypothetical protein